MIGIPHTRTRTCSRSRMLLLAAALLLTFAQTPSVWGDPPVTAQFSDDLGWLADDAALEARAHATGRYARDGFERAGCPQRTAWYAMPSVLSNQYSASYVGGGTAIGGESRTVDEGIWGLDYHGLLPRRIWLRWSHGRRYQGGTEGYKTDGPKLRH